MDTNWLGGRRSRSKITGLPPKVRDNVEEMIMNPDDYTLAEISEYLKGLDFEISLWAVYRHSQKMKVSLKRIADSQENLRQVVELIQRYPEVDYVEVMLIVVAQKLIDRLQASTPEEMMEMDFDALVRSVASIARTKVYKRRTDAAIQSKQEAGMQAAMETVFGAIGKDHPELYKKVHEAIDNYLKEPDTRNQTEDTT